MNIIIVTGASSGMGRETARQLDEIYTDAIDEIWLIARRRERMEELAATLKHKSHILELDLADEASFEKLKLELEIVNPKVKMLVNASGYGISGNFTESDLEKQLGMIKVNCYALTAITGIVLPYMPDDSRIIQYASSAAFLPQIGFSIYAATKAYVLSFSESLNTELKSRNITVTAVCPGPVDTEFFAISEANSSSPFKFKKFFMAEEKAVVKLAIKDSYKRKAVSVYSVPMKAFRVYAKAMPENVMLYFMDKMKGNNSEDEE